MVVATLGEVIGRLTGLVEKVKAKLESRGMASGEVSSHEEIRQLEEQAAKVVRHARGATAEGERQTARAASGCGASGSSSKKRHERRMRAADGFATKT